MTATRLGVRFATAGLYLGAWQLAGGVGVALLALGQALVVLHLVAGYAAEQPKAQR